MVLVSIIVPVYNAEKFLSQTLDSIINQTFENWECIIVDDGSIDSSASIANSFCEGDNRFKYYYQENSGPSVARNKGIDLARGEYLQFLDADDVIAPDRLDIMISAYEENEQLIYYSNLRLGEENNIFSTAKMSLPANLAHEMGFAEFYKYFGRKFIIIPACVLFPSNIFKTCRWNNKLSFSEDLDLYLCILNTGIKFKYIDKELVIYRNTSGSLSKNAIKVIESNFEIFAKWFKKKYTFTYINNYLNLILKNVFLILTHKTRKFVFYFPKHSFYLMNLVLFVYFLFPMYFIYKLFEIKKRR